MSSPIVLCGFTGGAEDAATGKVCLQDDATFEKTPRPKK
jgi:hypothetical protein